MGLWRIRCSLFSGLMAQVLVVLESGGLFWFVRFHFTPTERGSGLLSNFFAGKLKRGKMRHCAYFPFHSESQSVPSQFNLMVDTVHHTFRQICLSRLSQAMLYLLFNCISQSGDASVFPLARYHAVGNSTTFSSIDYSSRHQA